ncbi:hypothetical protein [Poseidonibacter sp.]|uniref:hypothetical protein n=1 Tax=Poseidonibacter sp. TaxID=2321188 RepID=UPI003C788BA7
MTTTIYEFKSNNINFKVQIDSEVNLFTNIKLLEPKSIFCGHFKNDFTNNSDIKNIVLYEYYNHILIQKFEKQISNYEKLLAVKFNKKLDFFTPEKSQLKKNFKSGLITEEKYFEKLEQLRNRAFNISDKKYSLIKKYKNRYFKEDVLKDIYRQDLNQGKAS